ncbi:hypothetical protein HKX48_001675 [Thoreauomyces humboldtii]|nr:hypothetical protein HKX48_001675 [Thoreauomyces humboldtii]
MLTSTYLTFYPDTTDGEANGVNCESGWKPYKRCLTRTILDTFHFIASRSGHKAPVLFQMTDAINWRTATERVKDAWIVCCQIQCWCGAQVSALELQIAITDDYLPLARAKAIIHALTSIRWIRNPSRISQIKNTHTPRKLYTERIVDDGWSRNPHVPRRIAERIAVDGVLDGLVNGIALTEEGKRDARRDAKVDHETFFERAQLVYTKSNYRPRKTGDRKDRDKVKEQAGEGKSKRERGKDEDYEDGKKKKKKKGEKSARTDVKQDGQANDEVHPSHVDPHRDVKKEGSTDLPADEGGVAEPSSPGRRRPSLSRTLSGLEEGEIVQIDLVVSPDRRTDPRRPLPIVRPVSYIATRPVLLRLLSSK